MKTANMLCMILSLSILNKKEVRKILSIIQLSIFGSNEREMYDYNLKRTPMNIEQFARSADDLS